MSIDRYDAVTIARDKVLPIYIMCDASSSMGWPEDAEIKPIDAINDGISRIVRLLREYANIAGLIELSVMSFASSARVILPLTKVTAATFVDKLEAGGTTNLKDAFELLAQTLSADYHAIRDRSAKAYRPAVFLFTDGVPTGDDGRPTDDHEAWLQPLRDLKAHATWGPRIYAYGFGQADEQLLRKMTDERGVSDKTLENRVNYSADDAVDSINRLFPRLFSTIIEGATAAAENASEEVMARNLDAAQSATGINSGFWDD